MKKTVTLLLVLILAMGVLAGCGSNNGGEVNNNQEESKFELQDGLLVYLDKENSPFEDSGFKISIKEGEYAEFIITDLEGNETVDYYKFDYASNTVEKYYYVSAMGTAFYYYYDLEAEELIKVENGDHEDSTEGMKASGRWDSAAEKTHEEITTLEGYFSEQYDMTIKEAVLGK